MYNDNDLADIIGLAVKKHGNTSEVMTIYHYVVNNYFNKHRSELALLAVNNQNTTEWYSRRLEVLNRYASINYRVGR